MRQMQKMLQCVQGSKQQEVLPAGVLMQMMFRCLCSSSASGVFVWQ
jgi:hypothetical protein